MAANRFSRCVGAKIRSGKTFRGAVAACKGGSKSRRTRSGRRRSRRRR